MTDAEYEELKFRIQNSVEDWKNILQLQDYLITVECVRGIYEEEPMRVAVTETLWEYRDARIIFYLGRARGMYKSVDEIVVHELTHVLLAPIRNNLDDIFHQQDEFVTENLARIFMKLANKSSTRKEKKDDN